MSSSHLYSSLVKQSSPSHTSINKCIRCYTDTAASSLSASLIQVPLHSTVSNINNAATGSSRQYQSHHQSHSILRHSYHDHAFKKQLLSSNPLNVITAHPRPSLTQQHQHHRQHHQHLHLHQPFSSFYSNAYNNGSASASGSRPYNPADWHATTILSVRKGSDVVVIGDGQVSLGQTVIKDNARKVRVIGNNKVITGFAGSTSDCFALLDRLEKKLEEFPGQLLRASVEMAKEWRTDKYLRHLEAFLIAVDKDISVTVTGAGDVMSAPDDGVIGIGSGGMYAISAARALVRAGNQDLSAVDIAKHSMAIASSICVYTNGNQIIEHFKDGQLQQTQILTQNVISTAHTVPTRAKSEEEQGGGEKKQSNGV